MAHKPAQHLFQFGKILKLRGRSSFRPVTSQDYCAARQSSRLSYKRQFLQLLSPLFVSRFELLPAALDRIFACRRLNAGSLRLKLCHSLIEPSQLFGLSFFKICR
jgi:hypothetical protein